MVINKNTIFYFSGTGNSLQISKDIAEKLGDTDVISISKIIDNGEIQIESKSLGIVFPVYMCGLPSIVDNFIKALNINKDTYVFAVATMGGMQGNSLKQINDLMENKNKKLNAGFTVAMPGNYIPMYGAKSKESQIKTFDKVKIKVDDIVNVVKEKKNQGYEKSNLLVEKVIAPLMYKKIGTIHNLDNNFWVKDNCTSCGICQKVCGVNNIEIKNGKPTWKNKCEQCMACIQYCPQEAIEYSKKTIGRKRYKNPNISLKDMINQGDN